MSYRTPRLTAGSNITLTDTGAAIEIAASGGGSSNSFGTIAVSGQSDVVAGAASTNAAVINTSTISYTNSDGTAGRTATLENVVGMMIPATPVIGTLVWFKLAAGDKGVRSIQSVTLATSLVTGSVSLLVARWMPTIGCTVAGLSAAMGGVDNPGVRLYTGTCLLHGYRAAATTATVVGGSLTVMER